MNEVDDIRLEQFRQMRKEIRGSEDFMIVGIDVAKAKNYAFYGTAKGKTLLKRMIFENSVEGFEKLLTQEYALKVSHGLIKVIYRSKDEKEKKEFDALEWLAAMCSHVPNKGEQLVRYYGFYSNVSRGKRKKQDQDELIPSILEPDGSSKEYRKNWARLIQKIYEVDPLTCPKCSSQIKVISVIEDEDVIKKILKHLGLWDKKARPPPKATGPPKIQEYKIDFSTSQLPVPARRPCGGSDKWLYVDPPCPEEFPA